MFDHACKAQTATAALGSCPFVIFSVCVSQSDMEIRSVKGGVEDTQVRILSLRTERTHPCLRTPAARGFDETPGSGATAGPVDGWG